MTVALDIIQSFRQSYEFRLEDTTLAIYERSIQQFLAFSGKPLDTIQARDIRQWLGELELKRYEPSTRNVRLFGLKLFFNFCLEDGFLKENPAKSIPLAKLEDKLPYYLTNVQLTRLREHVTGRLKQRAVVEVFVTTGVRISELIVMKKEDINWSERSILIPKAKRKKARIVLFTMECMTYLQAYLNERKDDLPFVFVNATATGHISKRTISYHFEKYSEALGFAIRPHTLRHTFAAHLARKGMSFSCIQTLLGHADPNNTQIYIRLYDAARKEMYDEWM